MEHTDEKPPKTFQRKHLIYICIWLAFFVLWLLLAMPNGIGTVAFEPFQLTNSNTKSAQHYSKGQIGHGSSSIIFDQKLSPEVVEPSVNCSAYCRQESTPNVGFPPVIYDGNFKHFVGAFAFRDMADLVLAWPNGMFGASSRESNAFVQRKLELPKLIQCLGILPIVYVRLPDRIQSYNDRLHLDLFRTVVLPNVKLGAILITGHSDTAVLSLYEHWDVLNHPKLIHWYGEEGIVPSPKFTYLPRGIMYMSQLPYVYHAVQNKQSLTIPGIKLYIDNTLREFESGARTKLISVNFNARKGFRTRLWSRLCSESLSFVECIPRTSSICNFNTADQKCKLDVLYKLLLKAPFVLSPPGLGMDTYRTSEALYLGRFPVIAQSAISDYYNDLPVVNVPNFLNLTKDFLISQLKKLRDRADSFNLQKLDATHWQKSIEMTRQDVLRRYNITDQPRRRCWGP